MNNFNCNFTCLIMKHMKCARFMFFVDWSDNNCIQCPSAKLKKIVNINKQYVKVWVSRCNNLSNKSFKVIEMCWGEWRKSRSMYSIGVSSRNLLSIISAYALLKIIPNKCNRLQRQECGYKIINIPLVFVNYNYFNIISWN